MALGSRLIGGVLLIGGAVVLVGAVAAAPTVLRVGRPVIRDALKRGMRFYEDVRGSAAEFFEDVEDMVAEVRAELTPGTSSPTEDATAQSRARAS